MRLFIAVQLPEEVIDYLKELQNELKIEGKLAKVKDFHLTLRFLGEVDDAEKVKELLKSVEFNSFDAKTTDIGVFPNESYMKVIWVGVEPKKQIIELKDRIEKVLYPMFGTDSRFHPHLTLARIKSINNKKQAKDKISSLKTEGKSFNVDKFCLIKNTLTPEGPVYEVLEEYNF